MLSDYMIDYRKMRAIVEDNAFLAVVNVEIFRNDVLTENETVLEALNRDVSYNNVIVLIGGEYKSCGVAGIFKKILTAYAVSYLLVKAELTVAHPNARYVLQVSGGLCRIHFIGVKMHAEFEIRH